MTHDASDRRNGSPLGTAHALLARALRTGFAAPAGEARDAPSGARVGHEIDVADGRAEITDRYVRLPDGTRHGVRRDL